MSVTSHYIDEVTQTVHDYLNQFDRRRPLPPRAATDARDILGIIEHATDPQENPVPNALKLKADLEDRLGQMFPAMFANLPLFDFCDLRNRLRIVMEKPPYTAKLLLIDNMSQLTKLANKDNAQDLLNRNRRLHDDVKQLQARVVQLEAENKTLLTDNTTLNQTLQQLQTSHQDLQKNYQALSEKNQSLYDLHRKSLSEIRALKTENAALYEENSRLSQMPTVNGLKR